MTQVDFYILPTDALSARELFACKLTEKAWRLGHRVYVYCEDQAQAQSVDTLLWQFRAEAFIPHYLLGAEASAEAVLIGSQAPLKGSADLLINLSAHCPDFTQEFARVAEIVIQEPASRQAARERFRFYREQGYALQNHSLTRL